MPEQNIPTREVKKINPGDNESKEPEGLGHYAIES